MKTVSRHPKHKPVTYCRTKEALHPYHTVSFDLHHSAPLTLGDVPLDTRRQLYYNNIR